MAKTRIQKMNQTTLSDKGLRKSTIHLRPISPSGGILLSIQHNFDMSQSTTLCPFGDCP